MPERKKTQLRPQICDYEGSNYRTEFWEGRGRDYEDRAERIAVRRLLPSSGLRLLEIGAGFGRLTGEYSAYRQVVLLDYSFSQLQHARQHYGDGRFIYVAADAYHMPFQPGVFDGASMIRTIHHMSDVPMALNQVRRVLAPHGRFVLEHANKRNLKAMIRYALRQQAWSPYTHDPVEFVELNFDFHPQYIVDTLTTVGFDVKKRIPVSFFRLAKLKELLPTDLLVALDSALQHTGLFITPSIFVCAEADTKTYMPDNTAFADIDSLFADPETGAPLVRDGSTMLCEQTGARYEFRDGIYDFKAPLD